MKGMKLYTIPNSSAPSPSGRSAKIEECHGGECSHQDVHPHRQDEEHHDGVGILHLGLCEDIGCRIAQQDTEQGVEKGDSDGIHKGIDGFGMRQEFLEIARA